MITGIELQIGGTAIDPDAARIRMESITTWSKDEPARALFTLESTYPQSVDPWANKSIEIWIRVGSSYALSFAGTIENRVEMLDDQRGWVYGYEAAGLELCGHRWPVRSPFDGTGSVTFNRPPDDPEYDPTYAGLSVGEMILLLLNEPATAAYLNANKVGKYTTGTGGELNIDPQTVTDLTGIDSVLASLKPSKPTTFEGDNLFQAIRGVLQAVAPNHTMYVRASRTSRTAGVVSGIVRFVDCSVRNAEIPLVMGVDPKPTVRRNYSGCHSRVVVRGGLNVQPMILTLSGGDLVENFADPPTYTTNAAAKEAWNLAVWQDQDQRKVTGTSLCRRPNDLPGDPTDPALTDPGWLFIDPDPAEAGGELSWGADEWDQDSGSYGGHLYIHRENGTGGSEWITRDVVGNTIQTAGGKSYLQLSADLPGTDYDKFVMTARRWPGLNTYRRYQVTATTLDGSNAARRARTSFPALLPWINPDGSPGSLTRAGIAEVTCVLDGVANTAFVGFEIDRENESIVFDRPLVTFFGTSENLIAGGSSVDGIPDEIRVLLPVAQNVLEVTVPPDVSGSPVYGGTSYTEDGIQRTRYVNNREWVSESDTGAMTAWASRLHEMSRDTVVEGSTLRYDYFPIHRPGYWVSWSDPCWDAGTFSRLSADVRTCTITWHHGGPTPIVTTYQLSNKREPYSSQQPRVYHPCRYPIPKPPEPSEYVAGYLISRTNGQAFGGNTDLVRESAGGRGLNESTIAAAVSRGVQSDADKSFFGGIDAVASGQAQGRGNSALANLLNFGGDGSGNANAANSANGTIGPDDWGML